VKKRDIMKITVDLKGVPAEVISKMIHNGMASTKSGAIHLALMHYLKHNPLLNP